MWMWAIRKRTRAGEWEYQYPFYDWKEEAENRLILLKERFLAPLLDMDKYAICCPTQREEMILAIVETVKYEVVHVDIVDVKE